MAKAVGAEEAGNADALARFGSFEQVVGLIRANRDVKLLVDVENGLKLVSYSPGRIAFEPSGRAEPDLAPRLQARLRAWTGARWAVTIEAGGAETIAEKRDAEDAQMRADAAEHPLVKSVLAAFPGAEISAIRSHEDIAAEAAEEALPEVDEEWDPFEDD